ncbi:MAG TPA: class I SAM-dependent methyltransferase [Actinomycetota bacterium]|jgi:SAM-dependent methyltransferase
MSPEVHPAAAVGFGRSADAYERGRPGFPMDAIGLVADRLGLRPGVTVLDLGAGTGKLSADLRATGATVLALEPVAAMRAALVASLPDVVAIGGVAERVPLADGCLDAAAAAQAFHWFDPDATIRELHRVLRPDGGLGLVWNVRDEDDPLQASLSGIVAPHRGDAPAYRGARWRDVFADSELFRPLERSSFRHEQRLSADGVVDRIGSISFIAALDPPERDVVTAQVRHLLGRRTEVVLPYRTDVWITRRAG